MPAASFVLCTRARAGVSHSGAGKSANILLDDAGFVRAVKRGSCECFYNAGQSCNAPTRMLVPRARLAEAERVAADVAASFPNGPLANGVQFERVQALLHAAVAEGARVVAGGPGRVHAKGFHVRNTVFSNVRNDMAIAQTEVFGPVLCIIAYDTEDEASTAAASIVLHSLIVPP